MFDQRFFIDKSKRKEILENLVDISGFLGWGKNNRNALLQWSIALGMDTPTPITGAKDGLVRPETIQSNYDMQAIFIAMAMYQADFDKDALDEILTESNIYRQSEECMNSGLSILAEFIDQHAQDSNYIDNLLLPEMDKLFEEIDSL